MASELSKFIDDELQKVDTAEERERLISKLRVRVSCQATAVESPSRALQCLTFWARLCRPARKMREAFSEEEHPAGKSSFCPESVCSSLASAPSL